MYPDFNTEGQEFFAAQFEFAQRAKQISNLIKSALENQLNIGKYRIEGSNLIFPTNVKAQCDSLLDCDREMVVSSAATDEEVKAVVQAYLEKQYQVIPEFVIKYYGKEACKLIFVKSLANIKAYDDLKVIFQFFEFMDPKKFFQNYFRRHGVAVENGILIRGRKSLWLIEYLFQKLKIDVAETYPSVAKFLRIMKEKFQDRIASQPSNHVVYDSLTINEWKDFHREEGLHGAMFKHENHLYKKAINLRPTFEAEDYLATLYRLFLGAEHAAEVMPVLNKETNQLTHLQIVKFRKFRDLWRALYFDEQGIDRQKEVTRFFSKSRRNYKKQFGMILLISALLREVDLNVGNIGVANKKLVRVDFELSEANFTSPWLYDTPKTFPLLTANIIDNLPSLPKGDSKIIWLNDIINELIFLKIDPKFNIGKWQACLNVLLVDPQVFSLLADPRFHGKKTKGKFVNRVQSDQKNLREIIIKHLEFILFLEANYASALTEAIGTLSGFKDGSVAQNLLMEDQIRDRFNLLIIDICDELKKADTAVDIQMESFPNLVAYCDKITDNHLSNGLSIK